jgi:SAM-dependent methyltransferase
MRNGRVDSSYNEAWLHYAWRRWLSKYDTGGALIDYGCGIGVNGTILGSLSARRVIGADLDWGCIAESRGRGMEAVRADLSKPLPVRSGVADIVFLIHCLEHFEDGCLLLATVADTLRSGGALVVVTPDWQQTFKHFYDDPTHRRPYTRDGLEAALRAAGLRPRVLLRHNVGYHVGWTSLWRVFPRLCFTGDALFAVAERASGDGM